MRPISLIRSGAFRSAIASSAIFLLSAILLLVLVYERVTMSIEKQIVVNLESQAIALEHELEEEGPDSASIQWPEVVKGEIFRFVVTQEHKVILNEIEPRHRFIGAVSIDQDEMAANFIEAVDNDAGMIGYGMRTPDGAYIFVGQEDEYIADLRDTLIESIIIASLLAFTVSISWGLFVAIRSYRRIEQLNLVASRVKAGDMARRMPISARADEIDLLSAQLNDMFDRLEQVMEAIKQVSSDIAHDLRTPLTRLQQNLDDIRSASDEDTRSRHIDRAFDEAHKMREIFGSMLRIAQLEGRAARAGFAEVDLTDLLIELADTYDPVFNDGGRVLVSEIAPGISVVGDAALLRQLFANLLENVITHTPVGTTATLTLAVQGSGWEATLKDDGPGVEPEHRTQIFRRFYRVDKSRTSSGSGLGLALVKAIAEAHDMTVATVDSGSGFTIAVRSPGQ